MLAYIRGTLEEMSEDSVILDHQGMGYQIYMSALDISELPGIGRSVLIYIHMNVREDGISLYGFRTKQAKEIFRLLIGISGVGPKAGMALLSALSVADIQMAVLSGDAKSLTKANGIGIPLLLLFVDCFVIMKGVVGFKVTILSILTAPASYPIVRTEILKEPKSVRRFHVVAGAVIFISNSLVVMTLVQYGIRIVAAGYAVL